MGLPKPKFTRYLYILSSPRSRENFAVPILLDFWMTSASVNSSYLWESRNAFLLYIQRPFSQSLTEFRSATPLSSTQERLTAFMMEPGS